METLRTSRGERKNWIYNAYIAGSLAIIAAQYLRNKRLQKAAYHDELTGLLNKRAFDKKLEGYVKNAAKVPFGVLFIDLDNFKAVNDNLGHDVGNKVLQRVATKLQGITRSKDVISQVGRLGGDEMAIIFDLRPHRNLKWHHHDAKNFTTEERFAAACNRVREGFDEMLESMPEELQYLGLNASMGGCLGEPNMNAGEIMELADRRMYTAKSAGAGSLVLS